MSEQRAVPAGEARILLVAALFYGFAILTIIVFAQALLVGVQASLPQLGWVFACAVAAFHLLKGSKPARLFLIAMSVFMTIGGLMIAAAHWHNHRLAHQAGAAHSHGH